jgi:hypothetical protein
MPWICSIYEKRPDLCRRYPEPGSFVPESCGYVFFGDGKRRGRCVPECEASCCRMPRIGGDPTATSLPDAAGGLPCRYLTYTEDTIEYAPEAVTPAEGVPSNQPDTAVAEE